MFDYFCSAIAVMSLKKMQQTLQPGCTQLSIYSEHLGLNVTTGAYKKTKNLSEILTDIRVIRFILDGKMPLFEKLGKYLQDRSFTLSADSTITLNLGTDNKKNRYVDCCGYFDTRSKYFFC